MQVRSWISFPFPAGKLKRGHLQKHQQEKEEKKEEKKYVEEVVSRVKFFPTSPAPSEKEEEPIQKEKETLSNSQPKMTELPNETKSQTEPAACSMEEERKEETRMQIPEEDEEDRRQRIQEFVDSIHESSEEDLTGDVIPASLFGTNCEDEPPEDEEEDCITKACQDMDIVVVPEEDEEENQEVINNPREQKTQILRVQVEKSQFSVKSIFWGAMSILLKIVLVLSSIFLPSVHPLKIYHLEFKEKNRITLETLVGTKAILGILDTGAECCVLDYTSFSQIKDFQKFEDAFPAGELKLFDSSGSEIRQATNPKMVPFTIGDKVIWHPICIIHSKMTSPFLLLGLCMMRSLNLSILMENGKEKLLLDGKVLNSKPEMLPHPTRPPDVDSYYVSTTTTLQPFQEKLVEVGWRGHARKEKRCLIINKQQDPSPPWSLPYPTSLDMTTCTSDQNFKIPIKNNSLNTVTLHENVDIATLTDDLGEIDAPGLDIGGPVSTIDEILDSDPTLTPNIHTLLKNTLANKEISPVFSTHEFDLSCVDPSKYTADFHLSDTTPIQCKAYKLDPIRQQQMAKILQKLVEHNIFTPCTGEYGYASPAFLIARKQDGQGSGKVRLILDYRRLNEKMVKNAYPLPHPQNLLHELKGGKYYTTLDIRSAFYAIPLSDKSSHQAAIVTSGGQMFRPKRLQMGLKNAPGIFTHCLNDILKGCSNTFIFMDDIVVVTREDSVEQHLRDLTQVLKTLQKAGIKINLKGKFCKKSIQFLGKIIDGDGARPLPSHVTGLQNFPPPTSILELQRFTGLLAWLSVYIPNYSSQIEPFSKMIGTGKFEWSEEHKLRFESLKKTVSLNSITYFPDFNLPLYLAVDAAKDSFGSILYQVKSYDRSEITQLQNDKSQNYELPPSSIETQHPVLPSPNGNVPQIHLQPTEQTPGPSKVIGAINYGKRDLTGATQMGPHKGQIQQVRVISTHSGVFQGPMQRYSSLEKEATALVLSVERCRDIFACSKMNFVVSDCRSLLWMLRLQNCGNQKIERLAIRLFSLPFSIIVAHCRGESNPADLLTRFYHVPPQYTKQQIRKAEIIESPFKIGEVVTVQDLTQALEQNDNLIHIPPHVPSPKVPMVKNISSISLSVLEQDLTRELQTDKLIQEQEKEAEVQKIRQKLLEGEEVKGFFLRRGVLMKERPKSTNLPPGIVVPKVLVPTLIATYHLGAHSGYKIISESIRQNFFVPKLEEKVLHFTRSCSLCVEHKASTSPSVSLGHSPLPSSKLSTWVMDLVSGLPNTEGFDSFLSIIDPFSGYRLAIPCRTTITAKQVARLLRNHILMPFGIPKVLQSDAGPNLLKSQYLADFCKFYNISRKIATPHSPKSHGRIEISNRVIVETMSILSEQYEQSWLHILPLTIHKLNARPRRFLGGTSPYRLVFLRDPPQTFLPSPLAFMDPERIKSLASAIDKKTDQMLRNNEEDMRLAGESVPSHIRPGTPVYLKKFLNTPKGKIKGRFWPSPVVVLHDFGQVLLVQGYGGTTHQVHKDNIKKCHGRDLELFQKLPTKVKMLLGEPFSPEEVEKAINEGDFEKFLKTDTTKPSKPKTRAQAREEERAEGAALFDQFPPDSESDSELSGPQKNENTQKEPKRRVRFQDQE